MLRRLAAIAIGFGLVVGLALEAQATSFNESGGDFGDTFPTRTLLPIGTDLVSGHVVAPGDCPGIPVCGAGDGDIVAFTSLKPGAPYTLTLRQPSNIYPTPVTFVGYNSSVQELFRSSNWGYFSTPTIATGIVPFDGELAILIGIYENDSPYEIGLDAPLVPEPSTVLLLGSGLATLAFSRRRRS